MTPQQLQDQLTSITFRLTALERLQVAPAPPPIPMTTSAARDTSIAAADADTESQLVRDLRAEIARLTERAGFINNEINQATLTIQELQIILKQPNDQTQSQLADWARSIVARLP